MIIAAGLTEINTRPAAREIPVWIIKPVSQEIYSGAVKMISRHLQTAIHQHRSVSMKIDPASRRNGQHCAGIYLQPTQNDIRQCSIPDRITRDHLVAEKMSILTICLQLDELLPAIKFDCNTILKNKRKSRTRGIDPNGHKNINTVTRFEL